MLFDSIADGESFHHLLSFEAHFHKFFDFGLFAAVAAHDFVFFLFDLLLRGGAERLLLFKHEIFRVLELVLFDLPFGEERH